MLPGRVTNVTSNGVEQGGTVEYHSSQQEQQLSVSYDLLVVATGAQYGKPIKTQETSLSSRKSGVSDKIITKSEYDLN